MVLRKFDEYMFIWKQKTKLILIQGQITPKVFGIDKISHNFGITIIISI